MHKIYQWRKIILNCILQLINVTFGFGDPHNTQTKLVPAQPFYRASNGIRIAYSLQKTLKFLLFCYNNCEDGLLDISFLYFFKVNSKYIFALSFALNCLILSQASSAVLQSEIVVDCISFDQWMTPISWFSFLLLVIFDNIFFNLHYQ